MEDPPTQTRKVGGAGLGAVSQHQLDSMVCFVFKKEKVHEAQEEAGRSLREGKGHDANVWNPEILNKIISFLKKGKQKLLEAEELWENYL